MRTPLRVLLAAAVCAGSACLAGPVSDWPSKDHDDPGDDGAPTGPRAPAATPPTTNAGAPGGAETDDFGKDVDAGGTSDQERDGGVDEGGDAGDGGARKRCTEMDDAGHCMR